MMFPKVKAGGLKTYRFPALDAGLNVSTSPFLSEQDQLIDAENMWFEQNRLGTRPGAVVTGGVGADYIYNVAPKWEVVHTGQKVAHGATMTELVYSHTFVSNDTQQTCKVQFYKLGGNGLLYPCAWLDYSGFSTEDGEVIHSNRYPRSIFVYKDTPNRGCGVYLLCFNSRFSQTDFTGEAEAVSVYEFSGDMMALYPLPKEEIYAPTIYVNGRGTLAAQAGLLTALYPFPQQFEELNLLTSRFCMLYTTDGVSSRFEFPLRWLSSEGDTTVTYTDNEGNPTVWTIAANGTKSNTVNNIYVTLDRPAGAMQFYTATGESCALPLSATGNNLHISTWQSDHTYTSDLREMRCGKWIEDAPGLTQGGNRLFLAGNPAKPALLAWCKANNPLYFPTGNRFTVGESGQGITTFAKQGGKLVIFKEHSIYAADYSDATAYNLQDVCAGRVTKVKSDIERMDIFQVHDSIGCDCPGTVQPCFERLVWANTDRRVYVLVTTHAFNSACIYELSEMIRERLMQVSDAELYNAFAINWKGKYILFAGRRQFVLNYGKQGFRYIHSYSSEQSAQKNISWYPWSIYPFTGFADAGLVGGFFHAEQCVLLARLQGDTADGRRMGFLQPICLQGQTDTHITWDPQSNEPIFTPRDIAGYFQTKITDFVEDMRYKQIRQVYIDAVEANSPLQVEYCTEQGRFAAEIVSGGPWLNRVCKLLPRLGKIQRFGLRVACNSAFALGGIQVQYKLLGHYK